MDAFSRFGCDITQNTAALSKKIEPITHSDSFIRVPKQATIARERFNHNKDDRTRKFINRDWRDLIVFHIKAKIKGMTL